MLPLVQGGKPTPLPFPVIIKAEASLKQEINWFNGGAD